MDTDQLLARLEADLRPVRRLAPPRARLGRWLLVSLPAAALVAWAFGLRPDLAARFAEGDFVLYEAAAMLTALAAAYAALCAGLPDQPAWKLWLPLAPMALWVGTLGRQCLDVLLTAGPGGATIGSDAMCLPAIAAGGALPAIAIVRMLRRGGAFRTRTASLCGALAAAALGAAALRLYHPQDAALMVMVWQLGSVGLLSLVAGLAGEGALRRGFARKFLMVT